MEKKSVVAGIAGTLLVVGGGFTAVAAVNAAEGETEPAPETVTVTVPDAEVTSDPVVVEAVPAPEPEPVEVEVTPAPEPVEAAKPAPAPKPAAPVEEGVTIVEPVKPTETWTGEDGRTYAPDPNNSDNPAAPPVIVEPEPVAPPLPPAEVIPPQG